VTVAIPRARGVARRDASTEGPSGSHRARLLWLLAGLVAAFVVVVVQLTNLQVVDPGRYRQHGVSQRTFVQSLAAERGAIYDRNGVELAMSRPSSSIFVDPELITDPALAAAAVAPVLGLPVPEVEAKMRGSGRFAYLARKVDDRTAERIRALSLPGVALIEESTRHHPSGDLARSVLGAVDVDNAGISGVEQLYGETLTGTPGRIVLERNPSGRTIPVGEHQMEPATRGGDLVLSLDRALQFEAERIVAEQVVAAGAEGGIAVVSRPDTGEILALANMVRNDRDDVVPGTNNAALTTAYEPGSVMKVVTVAAAVEAGLVGPDTVLSVPPAVQIDDAEFEDEHPIGGSADLRTILARSSNVGTIKVGQMLGKHRLHDAIRGFGFGQRTSVGFPNEQEGSVPAPADWWGTSMGTIPIGQGVSVTPLQMLMAYNVVANEGVYVAPTLVRAVVDAEGVERPAPLAESRRVVSRATADAMNLMLREVVGEGTGQSAAVYGYTPAGKTGTSWKPQPGGGYEDGGGERQYQATFVGFVPAEQPALSIIVVIDEPARSTGVVTGGALAAPAFSKLASFALRHLGVPPPLTDAPAGGAPVPSDGAGPENGSEGGPEPRSINDDGLVSPVERTPHGRLRGVPADVVPPRLEPADPTPATANPAGR
jgi:cell division protein FtsI (penicillin-binding protein 3)